MKAWHVYLICCCDGTLYVGITVDVQRRFKEHCRGYGSSFVRSHGVDHLMESREVGEYADARKLEKRLKTMTRARKIMYFRPAPYVGLLPPLRQGDD